MLEGATLLLLSIIYVFGLRSLLRRDMLFGGAYFYLYIYAIFALIGYIYRPEVSGAILAYFGPEIVPGAIAFIAASFAALYFGLRVVAPSLVEAGRMLEVARFRFNYLTPTAVASLGVSAILSLGLAKYWEEISYAKINDIDFAGSLGVAFALWFTLFKLSTMFLLVLYATWRYRLWGGQAERNLLLVFILVVALPFFAISAKVSNRLDLVSLFNGLVFVEIIRARRRGRSIAYALTTVFFLAAIVLLYAMYLKRSRGTDADLNFDWLGSLVFQDYFAPAHMLFAAMKYHIVQPLLVMASNSTNIVPKLGLPYLQANVTDYFNPGVTTRISSYAFYVFSEGYMFCGAAGFIYNAVIVTLGLSLWRGLANTRSQQFNELVLPLFAVDLANLARGQSAYFIKDIYFHFVPGLIMVFLVTGYSYLGFARSARESKIERDPFPNRSIAESNRYR